MRVLKHFLALLTLSASPLFAQEPPALLQYQGRMSHTDGTSVTAVDLPVVFRIYDSPIGGMPLFEENRVLDVTDGLVSALIGEVEPLDTTLFDDQSVLYLGVQFGTDSEAVPRYRLASVGYALRAKSAASADDVPGKDIHPSSVSIGSSPVIDSAGNWVGPTTGLVGPAGTDGADGAQGPAGPAGPTGPQGLAGTDGADGAPGPTGPAGPTGLQGPAGTDGTDGTQGPAGPAGPTGPQGPAGTDGTDGAQGPAGPVGPTGLQGPAGTDGTDGAQGPAGPVGATGLQGPAGTDGTDGAQGPVGPVGPTGPQGPAGTGGTDGAQGPAGPVGATGLQGPAGTDGTDGAQGPVGPVGPTGLQGPAGTDGTDGAQGPAGPIGPTGPQGPAGTDGTDGAQGPAGPIGPTGPQGPAGTDGTDGAQGPAGPVGQTGAQGPTGAAGPKGPSGVDGTDALWKVNGNDMYYNLAGYIGVGTAAPSSELHVEGGDLLVSRRSVATNVAQKIIVGGARAGSNSAFASLEFQNYDSDGLAADYLAARIKSHNAGVSDSGDLRFQVNDGSGIYDGMRLTADGDLGVGVTDPTAKLDVAGAIRVRGTTETEILTITGGADIVEGFETVGAAPEPGTVMVIDTHSAGALTVSTRPHDIRVAGVVSGAGGIRAGLRLGQEGALDGETPVAMTGRVYVRCSTENGAIRPGDLLTTAELDGHAMRVDDPARASGAMIGKAMTALEGGTGLVLVLVNLQ
ncbi:MAG: hypothetical protein AAF682_23640 [Planctomycetota bacterium]